MPASFSPLAIDSTLNPFDLCKEWLAAAEATEINDPNAMALATVSDGKPSVRMVLLKGIDDTGFVFYTNYNSRKAKEIHENPYVSLCLHWKSQRRQIRIEGKCSSVSTAEADAYFASRARKSQLGAWASNQSAILANRSIFEQRFADVSLQFEEKEVPRPPHWSGFRVLPHTIEFWQDMPFRLHDRTVFEITTAGNWHCYKLYP